MDPYELTAWALLALAVVLDLLRYFAPFGDRISSGVTTFILVVACGNFAGLALRAGEWFSFGFSIAIAILVSATYGWRKSQEKRPPPKHAGFSE